MTRGKERKSTWSSRSRSALRAAIAPSGHTTGVRTAYCTETDSLVHLFQKRHREGEGIAFTDVTLRSAGMLLRAQGANHRAGDLL
jgi:hypothetical protein